MEEVIASLAAPKETILDVAITALLSELEGKTRCFALL